MAAGAAAAAIPVVIHMIHTARAPRQVFPTLRFLRSASEKTARRRRIENVLLMLLRMALVAGLAMALARPILSERFGLLASQEHGAAVLVLDNSYSMNVRHEQSTRFGQAKQQARAILESPWRPAEAAVLLTNLPPAAAEAAAMGLSADRAALFRRVDTAPISSGMADLAGTLRAAYGLLEKAEAAEKRIWVLTDRQAASWEGLKGLEAARRHPEIPVGIIRVTEPSLRNVAVTGAEVMSLTRVAGMPIRVDVTVRNGGPAPENRHLLLFVDDLGQARQKVAVSLAAAGSAGASQVVSLIHAFERAGPHRLLAALEGTDSLDVDDGRRIAMEIAERIPVLVVKQRAAEVPFQDANFYLVRALDPTGGGNPTNGQGPEFPWAIRPVETTADRLETGALEAYDAVILNNLPAVAGLGGLGAETARALADYVANGGTAVVFCGPEVNAAEYNRLLVDGVGREGGLLPARLKERIGDAVLRTSAEQVTQVAGESPYLEGLVDAADIYQEILAYEHFRTEPAPAESVLARLSGGDPFLLVKAFGEGRVFLFTVPATADWSNFPIRNLFLPVLVRIACLASHERAERVNLVAGQPFEINLWPKVKGTATAEVTGPLGPGGQSASEQRETAAAMPTGRQADGKNVLRFEKTWNLGYYTWRTLGESRAEGLFSTNPDGRESDLAEIGDEKLRNRIGAREVHVAGTLEALVAEFEDTARRELWQYLLTVCLLVAVGEPLVANLPAGRQAGWAGRRGGTAHPVAGRRPAA